MVVIKPVVDVIGGHTTTPMTPLTSDARRDVKNETVLIRRPPHRVGEDYSVIVGELRFLITHWASFSRMKSNTTPAVTK